MFYCEPCRDREGWGRVDLRSAHVTCYVCGDEDVWCYESEVHPSRNADPAQVGGNLMVVMRAAPWAVGDWFELPPHALRSPHSVEIVTPDGLRVEVGTNAHGLYYRLPFGADLPYGFRIAVSGDTIRLVCEAGEPNPMVEFGPEDMGPRPHRIASREPVGEPRLTQAMQPVRESYSVGPDEPTLMQLMERAVQGDGHAAFAAFESSLESLQHVEERGRGLTAEEVTRMVESQVEAIQRLSMLIRVDISHADTLTEQVARIRAQVAQGYAELLPSELAGLDDVIELANRMRQPVVQGGSSDVLARPDSLAAVSVRERLHDEELPLSHMEHFYGQEANEFRAFTTLNDNLVHALSHRRERPPMVVTMCGRQSTFSIPGGVARVQDPVFLDNARRDQVSCSSCRQAMGLGSVRVGHKPVEPKTAWDRLLVDDDD